MTKKLSACKKLICPCFNWKAINLSNPQDKKQAFNCGILGPDPALTLCMQDDFAVVY